LDGPLPKLCPVIPTSNQDGRQAKIFLIEQMVSDKKIFMGISHRGLHVYVKLSSAVAAILVGVLKCRTQFWKRTSQESFQQSLVEIGSVVSEEKICF
jgi:hypothetical protein